MIHSISSGDSVSVSDLVKVYQLTLSDDEFTFNEQSFSAEIVGVTKLNDKDVSIVDYESFISIEDGKLITPQLLEGLLIAIKFATVDFSFEQMFTILPVETTSLQVSIDENLKENTSTDNIILVSTQNNFSFDVECSEQFTVKIKTDNGLVDTAEIDAMTGGNRASVSISSSTVSVNFEQVEKLLYTLPMVVVDKLGFTYEFKILINLGTIKERSFIFEPGEVLVVDSNSSARIYKHQLGKYYLPAVNVGGTLMSEYNILENATSWRFEYSGDNLIIQDNTPNTITAKDVLVNTYEQVTVVVNLDENVYIGYAIVFIKANYSLSVNESMKYIQPNSTLSAYDLITVNNNSVNITESMVFNKSNQEWNATGIQNIDIKVRKISTDGALSDITTGDVGITNSDIFFDNASAGKKFLVEFEYYFDGAIKYTNGFTVSVSNIFYNFATKDDILVLYSGQSVNLGTTLGSFLDIDGNFIQSNNYYFAIKEEPEDWAGVNAVDIVDNKLIVNDLFNDVIRTLELTLKDDGKTYIGYMQITCKAGYGIKNIKITEKDNAQNIATDNKLQSIEENSVACIGFDVMNVWEGKSADLKDFEVTYLVNGNSDTDNCISKDSNGYKFTPKASMAGSECVITFTVKSTNSKDVTSFDVVIPIKERVLQLQTNVKPNELNYLLNKADGINIDSIVKLVSNATINPSDLEVTANLAQGELLYEISQDNLQKIGILKVVDITENVRAEITITDKINGSSVVYTCIVIKNNIQN